MNTTSWLATKLLYVLRENINYLLLVIISTWFIFLKIENQAVKLPKNVKDFSIC